MAQGNLARTRLLAGIFCPDRAFNVLYREGDRELIARIQGESMAEVERKAKGIGIQLKGIQEA